MADKSEASMGDWMKKLDEFLTEYLVKKVPGLPKEVKEFVVKFSPWISLGLGLLALPVVLAVFRISSMMAPWAMWGGARLGMGYSIGMIVAAVQIVLQFMAIPGLMKRQLSGWRLVFYATLVYGVYSLITGNIGGLIIGTGISLYFLYQVKSYYK